MCTGFEQWAYTSQYDDKYIVKVLQDPTIDRYTIDKKAEKLAAASSPHLGLVLMHLRYAFCYADRLFIYALAGVHFGFDWAKEGGPRYYERTVNVSTPQTARARCPGV